MVAAALTASGVTVTPDATAADVHVLVIAEALKPEDHARLAAADRPIVTVLNKADLTGLGDGGPLTRAHRRAAHCRALTGVRTVPMVAGSRHSKPSWRFTRRLCTLHAPIASSTSRT